MVSTYVRIISFNVTRMNVMANDTTTTTTTTVTTTTRYVSTTRPINNYCVTPINDVKYAQNAPAYMKNEVYNFQKLDPENDRQTHRQTRPNALPRRSRTWHQFQVYISARVQCSNTSVIPET